MKYEVTIEFCLMCNYAPKVTKLAETLFSHLRTNVTTLKLIPSSGGVFEITVNGIRLHSKQESGEIPVADTIIKKIEVMKQK